MNISFFSGGHRTYHHNPMGKESIYPTKMMLEFAIIGTTPSAPFDLHPLAIMVFPIYGIGLIYGSIVPTS